jgi:hypothetical protein
MPHSPLKWITCRPSSPSILFCTTVCVPYTILIPIVDLFSLFRSLTDATLTSFTENLIVSLVYSHDVVARLSLGSVRDLRNAAMWLCEAEANGNRTEGWSAVTQRAKRWKDGQGTKDDMDWVNPSRPFCLLFRYLTKPSSSSPCAKLWKLICKMQFCFLRVESSGL